MRVTKRCRSANGFVGSLLLSLMAFRYGVPMELIVCWDTMADKLCQAWTHRRDHSPIRAQGVSTITNDLLRKEVLTDNSYKLVAIKLMTASKEHLEKHYADLSDKPFFKGLVSCKQLQACLTWVHTSLHWNRHGQRSSLRNGVGGQGSRQDWPYSPRCYQPTGFAARYHPRRLRYRKLSWVLTS